MRKFEIGRFLLSQIQNPKWKIGRVQSEISDLGFEVQESSNFKFLNVGDWTCS
jgi:hypothetical protein